MIIWDDMGRTLNVLKTVWAPAHKGSNPTPSATCLGALWSKAFFFVYCLSEINCFFGDMHKAFALKKILIKFKKNAENVDITEKKVYNIPYQ